ncbi:MAG: hypothetical protein AAB967_01970, partial [Patescibacteria group bacterium]
SGPASEARTFKQLPASPHDLLVEGPCISGEGIELAEHPDEAAGSTRFEVLDDEDALAALYPPAVVGVGGDEDLGYALGEGVVDLGIADAEGLLPL